MRMYRMHTQAKKWTRIRLYCVDCGMTWTASSVVDCSHVLTVTSHVAAVILTHEAAVDDAIEMDSAPLFKHDADSSGFSD